MPKANILLVDDRPENLLALEAILEGLGQNLVKAHAGEEALRLSADQEFAVILLDVRMHGLDGFETARLIRGRETTRHTPIIFLTAGEANRLSAEEAYGLGAVDYLVKPLVPVILRAKVAGFVELFEKTQQVIRQAEQLRMLAEERLRHSEQRFARFMQHLAGLAWIKDLEGRYVYVNDAAEHAFRTPRGELYGKTDDEVFPPETAAQFKENDRQALASGTGVQVIESLEHEGGTLHHSLVSKFPIPGPDGKAALVGGMAIDITDRRLAEEAVRQSEVQFRTLADSIPQLAWMARPDGHIFWYNQRWYDFTGTAPEQMEGWDWQSVHDPAELPRVLEKFKSAIASGEPWEDTFPLRRHDGAMRWHLSRALPVRDEQGRVVRWFGTNTDITDRRRMEEELKEADRRKDEFLATLAHELRNPLAPIRNGLQIMRRAGDDKEAVEEARGLMERQLQQMVRLIDDLLDVSRITRNRLALRKERIELATVVQDALDTSRPHIEASGHELAVTLPPRPIHVNADPTRLAQVFSNLLNNAAKYTEPGGRIALTAEREGSDVVVRVGDTGIGIPAEMLPRIFEMFTQVDRSLERSQGGLGIGLTLVRRLVELHGGSIEARSGGHGLGSEFVVRLPAIAIPPAQELPPSNGEGRGIVAPKGRRILVVDDNKDSATSMGRLLGMLGHEIRTAHDGQAAVDAAAAFRPDVILLDIGLPILNGYEAARRIRGQPFGKEMILIALTGWGQEDDRRRSKEAGFDLHLVKPVDPDALEKLLSDWPPSPS